MIEFSSGGATFALDDTRGLSRIERRGVPLSPRQLAVLKALAARPGRLTTREDLRREVWGGAELPDGTVEHAVRAIGAALGDDPLAPLFIETLPQRGWRFLPEPTGAADRALDSGRPNDLATLATKLRNAAALGGSAPRVVVEEARRLGEARDLPDAYFVALARGDLGGAAAELEAA